MTNNRFFDILGWLAIIATPVAPAYFFGEAVAHTITNLWLGILVGIAAAIGLESIGIFAGHTAVDAFRIGRTKEGIVATIVLLAYVGLGAYKLEGFGRIMFLMAPLGYLISGLRHAITIAEHRATTAETDAKRLADEERKAAQLAAEAKRKADEAERQRLIEEQAADRQRQAAEQARREQIAAEQQRHRDQLAAQRQARLDEQAAEAARLKHEEKLATIQAKTVANQVANSPKLATNNGETLTEYRRWNQVPPEVKQQIAAKSPAEVAAMLPHLPRKTRHDWHTRSLAEFATPTPHTPAHPQVSAD